MLIFDKARQFLFDKQPFVLYKKPNQLDVNAIFQKNNDLDFVVDFTESGFVFCDFLFEKKIIFKKQNSDFITEPFLNKVLIPKKNILASENLFEKEKHIKLVQKGIIAIENQEFTKVVLSRKEIVSIENISPISIFKKLLKHNPSAFTYLWYHPKVGLWAGSFGEQLLFVEGLNFKTASLAGTQKYLKDSNIIWQDKEKNEQQIVTDFIVNGLKNESKFYKVSEPTTIVAGNVVHLKSEISGELYPDFDLENLLKILHPTPAVCGYPKSCSLKFIQDNEGYNREFYAGFIGEININLKTNLFVNLRCLKINFDTVNIFVGGGITINSNPELEWEETVIKSSTTKNAVLQ